MIISNLKWVKWFPNKLKTMFLLFYIISWITGRGEGVNEKVIDI